MFVLTPATETQKRPGRYLRNRTGLIGTGLAQPKSANPLIMPMIGKTIVPSGSMWGMGFKVKRPCSSAVLSTQYFAIQVVDKYEIMGVPISEVSNLVYNRNLQKEIELWDMVYPRTNYILVHGASDYGTPVEFEGDNAVEFYPIEGYTIFDWRKIIENADEIHCIDSSLVNFVDCLDVEADLNYYITDKVPLKGDRTILTKKWNIINKL